jgi:hypothetical protein
MHYRVFYFFERSGECITSTGAVEMTARAIREQLIGRLHSEDDYLGIIDGEDNVLQILYEPGEDRYWVELPIEPAKASYGCHMRMDELDELLQRLPRIFDREQIPGMKYRPW